MIQTQFTQQGWKCPECGRIYSPTTPMCYYCPATIRLTATNATEIDKQKLKEAAERLESICK